MTHEPITLEEIRAARERLAGIAVRTPLVRLGVDADVWLKLENLQPIGSFKIRGAGNALSLASSEALAHGVWTASAGNMAQGAAWMARRLGVPCTVVVPESAPQAKLSAIERLGATFVKVPVEEWIEIFRTRRRDGMRGYFVHPFSDRDVMAGNGTIGLEILEDLPDVEAVLVPYGGGGLACGIASGLRAIAPHVKVYACEVDTAAPLAPSLQAGAPVPVEYRASFVDGIGAPVVFPEMLSLAQGLLAGSLVVSVDQAAQAVRLVAERNHVIAEGAGGVGVAAALAGSAGDGRIACVVSGGNIDPARLARILHGEAP